MNYFKKGSIDQWKLRMGEIYAHEIYSYNTQDKTLNTGDMVVIFKKDNFKCVKETLQY